MDKKPRLLAPLQPFMDMAANLLPNTKDDEKVIWFAQQQISAGELRALAEFAAKLEACNLSRMSETRNTSLGRWQITAVNLEAAYNDAQRELDVLRAAAIKVLDDLTAVGVEPFHAKKLRQASGWEPLSGDEDAELVEKTHV